MKAKLIKVIDQKGSSNGASCCYIFCFKGEDGKSYRSWSDDRLGNFKRWYNAALALVACQKTNDELWLSNLTPRAGRKGEIDADSLFTMERVPSLFAETFIPKPETDVKPERERKDLQ